MVYRIFVEKKPGLNHDVIFVKPLYDESGLVPKVKSERMIFPYLENLVRTKRAVSVYTPGYGGIAEAILKMSVGNGIGFRFRDKVGVGMM